jgi:drug/metabolite transporter (DMT)-like permease
MSLIWGLPYLLIKIAVRDLSAPTLVFARTAPAALLLIPIAAHRGDLSPLLSRWKWIVVYTLVEVAGPWLLLSSAEQRLSSSVSGLLIATVPLIGAVLVWALRHEDRVDRIRLLGLLIGFGGVALLVGVDVHGSSLIAVAEVAGVAVGYSCGPLIISRKFADFAGLAVVAASFAITAILYSPYALTHIPAHVSGEVILAVAGLAVICTAVGFVVFYALIVEVGPARSMVITYVNPVVAVLLGVIVLGESFTAAMAVSFPLILLGLYLATSRRRDRLDVPAPPEAAPVEASRSFRT